MHSHIWNSENEKLIDKIVVIPNEKLEHSAL